MIFHEYLTGREQEVSQKIYRNYIALGALAGTCSGQTIQVLLAVQLGISTAATTCISSIEYLKYLILPLGFLLTGRFGACGTMRLMTGVIALTCLLLAVSAVLPFGAVWLFFTAIAVMYASTACNASLSFPLQKNITTDSTLPRMISRNQIASSSVSLMANLAIAG